MELSTAEMVVMKVIAVSYTHCDAWQVRKMVAISATGDTHCHVGLDNMRCPYNGLCIDTDSRCDQVNDCVNGSDELNCCE